MAEPMRILYVEDSPADAHFLLIEFARTAPHIAVDRAFTCEEARDKIGSCAKGETPGYDLILTDMNLPDGNGMSLILFVHEKGLHIPVVALTGMGSEESAVASLKAGATDYVVKGENYLERLPAILDAARRRYKSDKKPRERLLHILYGEHNRTDIDLTLHHFSHYAPFIKLDVVRTGNEVLEKFPLVAETSEKPGLSYDALLIDYRLPDINGIEILRELLEVRRVDLPIVIVTGQGNEELAVQALHLGASDYVSKNAGYLYQLPGVLENAFNRVMIEREQRALAASEELFRTLVEKSTEVIQLVDTRGKPFYVSPPVKEILGYSPEEYLALDWTDLVHLDDYADIQNIVQRLESSPGATETFTKRLRHKDGTWRWVESTLRNLRHDTRIRATVSNFHDITERKKADEALRDSEERLRLKLDSIFTPDMEIEDEDLANVLDIPAIKDLIDHLYKMTGMDIVVIDINGKPLVETCMPEICAGFHRIHPETARYCEESDRTLAMGVPEGAYVSYTCRNNMRDYVTPLFVGGKHMANIFIGQIFYDDEEIDRSAFIAQAEKYGFDKDSYLAALDAVPRFSRERVQESIEFLAKFASTISKLSYSNLRLAQATIAQKLAGEALRAAQSRLSEVMKMARIAHWESDEIREIFIFNDGFYDLLGTTAEAEGGYEMGHEKYVSTFIHPDEAKTVLKSIKRFRLNPGPDGTASGEIRIVRRDDQVRHFFIKLRYTKDESGRVVRAFGYYQDITERKQIEETLRSTKERLSETMEMARITYWEGSEIERNFTFNDAFYNFMGTTAEREGGYTMAYEKYVASFVHPDDAETVFQNIRDKYAFASGEMVTDEHRIVRRDGQVRHVLVRLHPIKDEKTGEVSSVHGSHQDITEGRLLQEALQESEAKYRSIVENAIVGVAIVQDQKFKFVNQKFCEIHGYNVDEILGLSSTALVKDDFRPEIDKSAEARKIGAFKDEELDVPIVRKDGELRTMKNFAAPITLNGRPAVVMVCVDITKEKILETQLRQAQKMEAIGTLAGGVAHDFNNLLTVLTGYGTLLQMGLPEGDPLRLYTDQILSAAQKAANLTKSLLAFGRQHPIALKPLSVNDIVKETRKLLQQLLTEDVALKTHLTGDDTMVLGDVTQIDQILFNLASNARDAMPKGGTLTVETSTVEADNEFAQFHGLSKPGRYVLLSVSDTGTGMDKATRDKIFDPFFTTKEVGKGTGLGLATVYGIVKQHHGHIIVYSEPDVGTTFHIYLPAVKAKADKEQAGVKKAVRGGTETVLVAEDNEAVRCLMRDILKEYGYVVIEATDGQEAVDKFKEEPTVDLMIIDSVMPKKNGREVGDEVKALRPDVKLLFTSGYTKDVILDKGIEDKELDFISKPLSPKNFLEKVREVLDKR